MRQDALVVEPNPLQDDLRLPLVSIVIVNWNAGPVLTDCLQSLEAYPPAIPWEVILVDNGSRDGSVEAAEAAMPSVRVVRNPVNRGLPAANNQGIVAARGDYILISNPDVLYRDSAIDGLVDVMCRHPRAALAIPRQLYEDGTLQPSAGSLPTLTGVLLGRQVRRRLTKGKGDHGVWWEGWAHDEERQIGRGSEAAYLVRREAISDVGLQDEGFRLDWEGPDWTARMAEAGWEIWFTPAASVVHLGGGTVRQVRFRWILGTHRGMYRYFAKRSRLGVRPLLALVFAARCLVKLGVAYAGVDVYERAHRQQRRP
jgi:GT2 family glycosyltransferase